MRWLVVTLALVAVALTLELGLLAYSLYAFAAVLVLSRGLANRWSSQLSATRGVNRAQVNVGETVAVATVVQYRGWLPLPWLLVEDLLPKQALSHHQPNLQITGRRLQLVGFRGRGQKTLSYQVRGNRRGYYQLGPLVTETGDLFGLYRRYRVLSEPHFLLVLPEVIPLAGFEIASRRPIGEVRLTHRLFEDPTRTAGVRAYQPGDPLNRIHWRATARVGALQTRSCEPSAMAGATLVLDFHQDAFDPAHEPVRSELAITAAASLAGALHELGQPVGLITNGRDAAERISREGWTHQRLRTRQAAQAVGDPTERTPLHPVIVPTRRSSGQLRLILESLGRLEKSPGLPFDQLVRDTASQMPQSAAVIAILSRVTVAMAVTLGGLRRRGVPVTAIVSVHDDYDLPRLAAPLIAQRIEVRPLRDRAGISQMCQRLVPR